MYYFLQFFKTSKIFRLDVQIFALWKLNYVKDWRTLVSRLNNKELLGWSDEESQAILSSWQHKTTKVKLIIPVMNTERPKDICAGFDLGV